MQRRIVTGRARIRALIAGCVLLAFAAIDGSVLAQEQHATLSCEQLGIEFALVDRRLAANMPDIKISAVPATLTATTPDTVERSTAITRMLDQLGQLSGHFRTKRCVPGDVQRTATYIPSMDIADFALSADTAAGRQDFKNRCAMCHGDAGKGDGWFAKYLKHQAPPLVELTKRAGGAYPYTHLYAVVDGRREVAIHGPRDMPVWGATYSKLPDSKNEAYSAEPLHRERIARARIFALLKYMREFQE